MGRGRKHGSRPRFNGRGHTKGYRAGDMGTAPEGPAAHAGAGAKSYVAAMDTDGPLSPSAIFGADEIERTTGRSLGPGLISSSPSDPTATIED